MGAEGLLGLYLWLGYQGNALVGMLFLLFYMAFLEWLQAHPLNKDGGIENV